MYEYTEYSRPLGARVAVVAGLESSGPWQGEVNTLHHNFNKGKVTTIYS